MRGLDGFSHGTFDNADFWGYKDASQFDPGGMLDGMGEYVGGCDCGVGDCLCGVDPYTGSNQAKGLVMMAIGVALGYFVGKSGIL